MAVAPKFTPRTTHIALKYHHFKAHVENRIDISYILTDLQKADIFTKPHPDDAFFRLRHMLMGWYKVVIRPKTKQQFQSSKATLDSQLMIA
eukprot:scaffold2611_cov43-Cyclotella_meneghiniana.AAC.3